MKRVLGFAGCWLLVCAVSVWGKSAAVGTTNFSILCATLQQAVDLANDGDTIWMSSDTFNETVMISNKHVTILGGYDDPPTNFIDGYTAIDASGAGTALWFIKSRTSFVDRVAMVGGAGEAANLWVGGGCLLHESTVEFSDCTFASNTASAGGGLFVGLFSYAKLDGASRVFSNTAVYDGGGIYVDGQADIVHEDADVFANTALDGSGGGIYVLSGRLRLLQGDVYNNLAVSGTVNGASAGGGVFATESYLLFGDGAEVTDNEADFGGGLGMVLSTGQLGNVRFRDVLLNGNRSDYGGGLYALNSAMTLHGIAFEDNSAENDGGGASIGNTFMYGWTNPTVFNRNTAGGSGGGLYLVNSTSQFLTVSFGETVGDGNEAGGQGGGLYATNASVYLGGGYIAGNRATNTGGNAGWGGGLCLYNSYLLISNGWTEYVGGYTNMIFEGNEANPVAGLGGGIYLNTSNVEVHALSVEYLGNTASKGGAVYCHRGTWYSLYSRYEGNVATSNGGAAYLDGTLGLFAASDLIGNQASNHGGAVYGVYGLTHSDHSRFLNNAAGRGGGAIHMDNGTGLYVYAMTPPFYYPTNGWVSLFQENSGYYGGAIRVEDCDNFILQRTTFISNDAFYGDAVDSIGSGVLLQDNFFDHNGTSYGQGMRFGNCTGIVLGCTVRGDGTGGGMQVINSSDIAISNSILWACGGSPVYVDSSSICTVMYSCVEGGEPDPSNITDDPQLMANGHLLHESPCINAGSPNASDLEIDGESRVGNWDMGCDEFIDTDGDNLADVSETGTGQWVSDFDTGTDHTNPDSDGDQVSDGDEWTATTDPNNPGSFLHIESIWIPAGQTVPWIRCINGRDATLEVEWTSSCLTSQWTSSLQLPPPVDGTNEFGLTSSDGMDVRLRAYR